MKHEIEVVIIIDRDGNYSVGADRDTAIDAYTTDIDDTAETLMACRIITQKLTVEMPAETVITAHVPAVAESVEVQIA